MAGVHLLHHRIQVMKSMKQDLGVWLSLLEDFNRVMFWKEDLHLEAELQAYLDTAGSLGFGVYFHRHWCTELWPQEWVSQGWTWDFTFLEFFPILITMAQVINSLSSK